VFEGFRRERIRANGVQIAAVVGGSGPPLLLLHGYPQTHAIWHKVAPRLAQRFTVVATDLRGYGDSAKPPTTPDHAPYSKREMARDQVEAMRALGFERFFLAGHDRGARVAHRLAADHGQAVRRAAFLDIAPTLAMYEQTNQAFATAYWHWFFLIQPPPFPETLIGANPQYLLKTVFRAWSRKEAAQAFAPAALAEYARCFATPQAIHATCEDYRASAGIDLEQDRADLERKLTCPLLVLWGESGWVGRAYDPPALWRERATDVRGHAVPGGHFLPEEAPQETLAALEAFFDR